MHNYICRIRCFLTIAYFCRRDKKQIRQALFYSALTGLLVGVISDLLWEKFLGLWSYALGYEVLPLFATAVCIWGLFSATVLIMNELRLIHFSIAVMVMMLTYEIPNYFLEVLTYEFNIPIFWFLTFLIIVNFIAMVWHIFPGKRFRVIAVLQKKEIEGEIVIRTI